MAEEWVERPDGTFVRTDTLSRRGWKAEYDMLFIDGDLFVRTKDGWEKV